MQRALLSAVETMVMEEVEPRQPAAGEARVAIEACGICGSDLHMYHGDHPVLRPPLVMGHEFVGHVVGVGEGVTNVKPGDRVIGIAGRGCGECEACQEGNWNWCEQLKVIGGHVPGALAEEIVLPAEQFIAIPDWIPDDQATLIEVGAVGMHTIHRYGSVEGRSCLVLGAGPVGLVLVKLLKALGASAVVVSDISDARRDLAHGCGADMVIDPRTEGAEEQVRATFPRGLDVAFDCAGREDSLLLALRLTRRGASIVLTAIFQQFCQIPMALVQRAERQLIGVQMYKREDFEAVIRLLEERKLDLGGIVTHEFPLRDTAEAFRMLATPGAAAGKVLVRVRR
ncbi:MAG: alcohol dehydrogenase catalytic domain-containing protein [Chloroflexi bacterium]|nr:alcohol dehydrogenase catalytic domain-containing protein [Chloroflexota bacterium]